MNVSLTPELDKFVGQQPAKSIDRFTHIRLEQLLFQMMEKGNFCARSGRFSMNLHHELDPIKTAKTKFEETPVSPGPEPTPNYVGGSTDRDQSIQSSIVFPAIISWPG